MSNPTELPDMDRAEFEAAWRAKYDMPSTVQFSTFSDGRYQASAINDFYEGWCMARRGRNSIPKRMKAYAATLQKIATVNAMDYEYQNWARQTLGALPPTRRPASRSTQ